MSRLGGQTRWRRRAIVLIALSIVLGLITTWAVAWGCVIWNSPTRSGWSRSFAGETGLTPDGRFYVVKSRRQFGLAQVFVLTGRAEQMKEGQRWIDAMWNILDQDPGPVDAGALLPPWTATAEAASSGLPLPGHANLWSMVGVTPSWRLLRVDHVCREEGAGWPRICLRSLHGQTLPPPNSYSLPEWVVETVPGVTATYLPRELVLHGLLGNMAFYSPAWAAVFAAPGVSRRVHRPVRGRCPLCDYNVRHGKWPGCPECGWGREEVVAAAEGDDA